MHVFQWAALITWWLSVVVSGIRYAWHHWHVPHDYYPTFKDQLDRLEPPRINDPTDTYGITDHNYD